jgi:Tripartite tricarboxylate transporter family receptor
MPELIAEHGWRIAFHLRPQTPMTRSKEAAMGNRSLSHLLTAGVLFAAFGMTAEPAWSESWPERTVRIVTPFNPGISVDVAARTLADALAKQWKQPAVVENRPGADTMIGTQAFLDMRDNHALLFTTHSTFTVIPLLRAKVPYDPADVKPISLAVEDFLGVVASPKLEIGSLSQFVEIARKTRPSSTFMPYRARPISLTSPFRNGPDSPPRSSPTTVPSMRFPICPKVASMLR